MEAEIIKEYFFDGFQYNIILLLLAIYHGIHISCRLVFSTCLRLSFCACCTCGNYWKFGSQ